MPVPRPAGVLCPKWEPDSPGSKKCRYYIPPSPEELQVEGLCRLPDEMLCVEWVRRYGTDDQRTALALRGTPPQSPVDSGSPAPLTLAVQDPPPPKPPTVATPPSASMPFAGPLLALPRTFEPAKEVDPIGLAALEQAGVEVDLDAAHLGGTVTLVARRTGRSDRSELTFREGAVLRQIVDAFPGAHVVGYRHAVAEPGNRPVPGLPARQDPPAESCPPTGTRCGVCGEPQRLTPGGPSCRNGHGGAEPLDPLS